MFFLVRIKTENEKLKSEIIAVFYDKYFAEICMKHLQKRSDKLNVTYKYKLMYK